MNSSLVAAYQVQTNTTIEDFHHHKNHFDITTSDGKSLKADAVIVSTGFDLFKSSRKEEYGYGIYDNVITSADLENLFRKNDDQDHNGADPEEDRYRSLCRVKG